MEPMGKDDSNKKHEQKQVTMAAGLPSTVSELVLTTERMTLPVNRSSILSDSETD